MKNNNLTVIKAFPLALQHVVAMVVGCITVPILVSNAAGISSADSLILVQASLFGAAIAILIQAYGKNGLGSGLPVIAGSGFAIIATY
ncbi:MAG: solute carrier family 23 protein, partial [Bacilli bacterium]